MAQDFSSVLCLEMATCHCVAWKISAYRTHVSWHLLALVEGKPSRKAYVQGKVT